MKLPEYEIPGEQREEIPVSEKTSEKVSTDSLLKKILRTKNLNSFLQRNEQYLRPEAFPEMLRSLCERRGLVPERVIQRAQIDRTYGHQLFNGTRRPSRDKVLQLAISIGLSLEETQQLLQAAGRSPLYPRLKRDAALIFCLKNGYDMMETQEILGKYEISLLGE